MKDALGINGQRGGEGEIKFHILFVFSSFSEYLELLKVKIQGQ